MISVSLITTAVSPYLLRFLPSFNKRTSIIRRCAALCGLNILFIAPMGVLDVVLDRYPEGRLAFVIILVLRALQGLANGLLFLILQVILLNVKHKTTLCVDE